MQTSITLVTSFLIFILFISFGYTTYNLNSALISGTTSKIHEAITNKILGKLDIYLETPYQANNLTEAFLKISPDHLRDLNLLRKYLYKQLSIFKSVNLIAFGTEKGDYVEAQRLKNGKIRTGKMKDNNLELWETNSSGERLMLEELVFGYDPRLRPWYTNSKEKQIPTWSDIYFLSSDKKPAISANQPYFYNSNKLEGVITTSITLAGISNYLEELANDSNLSVLILEPSGLAIATSKDISLMNNMNRRLTGANLDSTLFSSISRFFQLSIENNYTDIISNFSMVIDNTRYLIKSTPYFGPYNLRWNVLVIIPENNYMSAFYKASTVGIIFLIASLIITLISNYFIAGRISKPIVILSNIVSGFSIKNSNLTDFVIPENILSRNDEIGTLAGTFIDMKSRLESVFKNLNCSLEEKNVLLKEIHHRVKNNLQIITSLINLQLGYLSNGSVQETLESLQSRIQSISLVHEMLYSTESFTKIDFYNYLNQIISTISDTFNNKENPIIVNLEGDAYYMDIERSTTCGLILNEIIINAFKHAFINQFDCRVNIKLNKDKTGLVSILVQDNGIGVSSLKKSGKTQGMGALLIEALLDQISGEMKISKNNGTSINLSFQS